MVACRFNLETISVEFQWWRLKSDDVITYYITLTGPRLHDEGKIGKRNKPVPFQPCVYTIPVEKCYETVMKLKRSLVNGKK